MESVLFLLVGIFLIGWGVKHRTSDDDRTKYDKRLKDCGLSPSSGFDSAFQARMSQTRSNGNFAIGVGVLLVAVAFIDA